MFKVRWTTNRENIAYTKTREECDNLILHLIQYLTVYVWTIRGWREWKPRIIPYDDGTEVH